MACATPVGQALTHGISHDEASLVTQQVEVGHTSDKAEAKDKCGNVISVAYYNTRAEISIQGLGQSAQTVGATLSLSGSFGTVGTVCVDKVTITKTNEGFVSSAIEATGYKHIV